MEEEGLKGDRGHGCTPASEKKFSVFAAYITVTVVAASANIYAAANDFIRPKWLLSNMNKVGVPGIMAPHPRRTQGSRWTWIADRHSRAADWDRRGRWRDAVLYQYQCGDHTPPGA
jgi:hypothetical protein